MRRILSVFTRGGGPLLFLLLEGICFYLIVTYNKTQREVWINSSNVAVGYFKDRFHDASLYASRPAEIDALKNTNTILLDSIKNLQDSIEQIWFDLKVSKDIYQQIPVDIDTSHTPLELKYNYIVASVIDNSVSQNNNSLTLDRGSKAGVHPRMGVIGSENTGVVGIVRNVSRNYAEVMSILNRQTRINVAAQKNGAFGPLIWQSSDPRKMNLVDIPKHIELEIGDTIITSGYSQLFPRGVLVGTIDTLWPERGTNFWNIDVKLFNDMTKVSHVYIVENPDRLEITNLQEERNE